MKKLWKSQEQIEEKLTRQEQEQKHQEMQAKAQAILLNKIAEDYILAEDVSDEEKDMFINLFDLWEPNIAYTKGDKLVYEGLAYEVIQAHTSQSDWLPNELPALYKLCYQTSTEDGTTVIPEWKQSIGVHDAYNTGDLVSYNEIIWESDVDGNVWVPGVYGWTMID